VSERRYTIEGIGVRLGGFLRTVLDGAGLRASYDLVEGEAPHPDFENPEITVRFSGPDVDLLLGNRAELLLALEHLTMEYLRLPAEDHSRICFDAHDYRALRIEELRLSAAAAAEKVKQTGKPFFFNPMTSRERRVIHLALRHENELRSESTGTGAHRQVVVYPKDMPSVEPPPRPQPERPARRPGRFADSGAGGRSGGRRDSRPRRRGAGR